MNGFLRKTDIALIVFIALFALSFNFLFGYFLGIEKTEGAYAVIKLNGEQYRKLPLNQDDVFNVKSGDIYNIIEVKNGVVRMIKASCPDQVCVRHRSIRFSNETIVCLPNKLVIEIIGGEDSGIDTYALLGGGHE